MGTPYMLSKFLCCSTFLLSAAALVLWVSLSSCRTTRSNESGVSSHMPQTECTFSNGSTITFGRQASDSPEGAADSWHAGEYEATSFRVSGRVVVPPMSSPLKIPAGRYTLFVMAKSQPPWTLIVSKKTDRWGMPYPGEQYDLGRVALGSDVQRPLEKFMIGCMQPNNAPIFVWMQSGKYVGYAKIMAETIKDGTAEYLWH